MTQIGGLDVFGAGIEVRPLKEPGICFICEAAPQQDNSKVINTMRYFSPGPLTNLNGTKYVCESCAHDLGVAIGLVDAKDLADATAEAAHLQILLNDADEQLAAFDTLEAAIKKLTPPEPATSAVKE